MNFENSELIASESTVVRTMSLDVKDKNSKAARSKTTQDFKNIDIHTLPIDKALVKLGAISLTNGGLSEQVAGKRLKENGPNSITPAKNNQILKILGFFFGGFCLLMWCAAILMFLTYYPLPQLDNSIPSVYNLAVVILIIIDWSSSSVMGKINNLLASEATVIRGGKSMTIPSTNVVVGDIVELRLGAKIPADCLVFEASSDLAVDRSILTGESIPVAGTTNATDVSFLESKNVGFMGTMVLNGSAKAVV
ncbi:hypothetical protein HDU99_010191, partial [Rhizoclosmatium hyalinum]